MLVAAKSVLAIRNLGFIELPYPSKYFHLQKLNPKFVEKVRKKPLFVSAAASVGKG